MKLAKILTVLYLKMVLKLTMRNLEFKQKILDKALLVWSLMRK